MITQNDVLTEKINELSSRGTTRKKLINSCVFLLVSCYCCCIDTCDNEGRHWNNDSMTLASIYHSSITTFSLVTGIVQEFMQYTKSLTVRLQSKTMDIANAFMHVPTLNATLHDLRTNINIRHQSWYGDSVKLANDHHIAAEKPRCCKTQLYRDIMI